MSNYGIYAIRQTFNLFHIASVNHSRNADYLKTFGEHIRKVRKMQGLTMMQLAYEADLEYSQIAKIERGLSNTTISTVLVLANALQVKPAELFQFTLPPKANK